MPRLASLSPQAIGSRLIARNATVARWYYGWVNSRWRAQGRRPVAVYSMPKSGSTTLAASLAAAEDLRVAPFQVHNLTGPGIANAERSYARMRPGVVDGLILTNRYVRKRFILGSDPEVFELVTIVRDPVSRNMSAFFQNVEHWFPAFRAGVEPDAAAVRAAASAFFRTYEHQVPLCWLDDEVNPALGIDVYAEPFSPEKGYHIYRSGRFRLLLIRLEDLDRVAEAAMGEFLGARGFQVVRANVGDEKRYSDLYRRLREMIVMPDAYLDEMYGSRYARHFYGPDEIAAARAGWAAGPA